ncbi:MAG: zinc-dependent peptidase [Acidobacteriota bacterium]
MKIAYKNELIFKLVYFILITLTGLFLSIYSSGSVIPVLSVLVLLLYTILALKKEFRRLRIVKRTFPTEWRDILVKYSKFYNYLDTGGKEKFEKDIMIFLNENSIRGIRGEEPDLTSRVLVAAGVATILHGRSDWEPPFYDGVVVYPGETFDPEYNLYKGQIAGMAGERRPMLVTKEILEKSFMDPDDGYNSLIHEISHYFDFENPQLSGVPLIGTDINKTEKWISVMEKEREKVNRGESFLRHYAGSNEAEFFAVATEFFFERPDIMADKNPELYFLLKDFYNLDMLELFNKN